MLLKAAQAGAQGRAALIAAILSEPGLGGREIDLGQRLANLERDRSQRARDARLLAGRWAAMAGKRGPGAAAMDDGALLALAFPERVAKARGKLGEFQLTGGRGVHLDPADPLARSPWLAVAELGGGDARDRILLAAPLDAEAVEAAFMDRIEVEDRLAPDAQGRLKATRLRRLGKLILSEIQLEAPDPATIRVALLSQARREGLAALPLGEASTALRARAAFAGAPDLSDAALTARLEDWLAPLLDRKTALSQLSDGQIAQALDHLMSWEERVALDKNAPARFTAPTGSTHAIDYAAEGGPRVSVRVGELYGLSGHPSAAGQPLVLELLSPAHRPIQVTKDLPGFWAGSWKAVRTEMKGRYPRHVWPEDPANAAPVTRAKPRGT
jgi:ATP-dependent helicase HrpB